MINQKDVILASETIKKLFNNHPIVSNGDQLLGIKEAIDYLYGIQNALKDFELYKKSYDVFYCLPESKELIEYQKKGYTLDLKETATLKELRIDLVALKKISEVK